MAIIGATLIDVSQSGHSAKDIPNSVVLIAHGRIIAAGDHAHVHVPRGARILDARGKFLIPGLIDGYGALRNARFAAAYLYEGVTTVVVPFAPPNAAIDGERQIIRARLGPAMIMMAPISGYAVDGDVPNKSPWTSHRLTDQRLDEAALKALVMRAAAHGARMIAAEQDVWPDQLATIVSEAHRRGLGVTAQPAFTTYQQAIRIGVDAFTRNDHYSLALAPSSAFASYADDPRGTGARPAVRSICRAEELTNRIEDFGQRLAHSKTALMPILSMEATADDVGAPNPWTLPSAVFVGPTDLDDPVDRATGARPYLAQRPAERIRIQSCARSKQAIDRGLHAQGATYLAGTATPSFGVIPGGGLHVELRLLTQIGLTPREALATATANIASSFHLDDRGEVAAGRRADLVLLRHDPRENIAAIETIAAAIIGGRIVDRSGLRNLARTEPATRTVAALLPTPRLFAPGIVSGPDNDGSPTSLPDGRTLFFERSSGHTSVILETHRSGSGWAQPDMVSFSGAWPDQQPAVAPGGGYLIYSSARHRPGRTPGAKSLGYSHLWRVDRTASDWSPPVELPKEVNISDMMFRPSIAANGDLYFMSATKVDTNGPMWRLFCAAKKGESYAQAQPLPFSVGGTIDVDPFIAPAGSYLIFSSKGRSSPNDGNEHLFIALRQGRKWGKIQPLHYAGDTSGFDDGEAQVSADGRRLYFTSARSTDGAEVARTSPRRDSRVEQRGPDTNVWYLPLARLLRANGIPRTGPGHS